MNTYVTVCHETMSRLEGELEIMMKKLRQEGGSVGNALQVSYDQEWASKNEVGTLGRMTVKEGVKKYHVAPIEIDRGNVFSFGKHDVIENMHALDDGKKTELTFKALTVNEWPKSLVPRGEAWKWFEGDVFKKIVTRYDITLVNPSMGAMAALMQVTSKHRPGYVYLSASVPGRVEWIDDIKDFLRDPKCDGKLVLDDEVHGICYLGLSDPKWYPDTPWFRVAPAPYVEMSKDYQEYNVVSNDLQVRSEFVRKGVYSTSTLTIIDRVFRYNPATVKKWLGRREEAYIESSVGLVMEMVEMKSISHLPRFINGIEVRTEVIEGVECALNSYGLVINVHAPGTYYSKRARFSSLRWAPYERVGTHYVTLSTNNPQFNQDISVEKIGDTTVVSLDGSIPISIIVREERVPVFDEPLPAVPTVHIDGREQVFVDILSSRYFPKPSMFTGVAWNPADKSLPVLSGYIADLATYVLGDSRYVDISSVPRGGIIYIASTYARALEYLPGISKVFSSTSTDVVRWAGWSCGEDDGGYGCEPSMSSKIVTALSVRVKEGSSGIGLEQLSLDVGLGYRSLIMYLSKIKTVLRLPGRDVTYSLETMCDWRFSGDEVYDWLCCDGRTFTYALSLLRRGETIYVSSPGRFRELCALNDFNVWCVRHQEFWKLTMKWC